MRKGQNPARHGTMAYHPRPLGVASLVYIPDTSGYFEQSLQVFKLQAASLHKHTKQPFDFLVFDNGSCPEVQAELQRMQQQGWIDWLVLSRHNLGKTGALNWILSSIPNEWICYTDSDVLFREGWDEASCQIFASFPRAGIVTAQPCFFDILRGTGQADQSLAQDEDYTGNEWVPADDIVEEYCRGLGDSPDLIERYRGKPLRRAVHAPSGVEAVLGASHMQFLTRGEIIRTVVPLPAEKGLSPEEDRILDQRVDSAGYLHLSTLRPYVVHLGNTLDLSPAEAQEYSDVQGVRPASPQNQMAPKQKPWSYRVIAYFARQSPFKALFRRLYNALFRVYSSQ